MSKAPKTRLDALLLARGLARNRREAEALIRAGEALVNDTMIDKPGAAVRSDVELRLRNPRPKYVSRGGLKLEGALLAFRPTLNGAVCADFGASTGGFTDCLLQAGARRVYAIDVGYGQLAWSLQTEERVVVMDRTDVQQLDALPDPIDLVVGDLSFISLRSVLPNIVAVARPGGQAIVLVKPQFEAKAAEVVAGGRVIDEAVHERVLAEVATDAEALGCTVLGSIESPIRGAKARNRELLLYLQLPA